MTAVTPAQSTLSFAIDGKPHGKQRARRGKGGRWYTPSETSIYEGAVAVRALLAMRALGIGRGYAGPVVLSVRCYFPDARRRDGDNVLKAVQDALNGIVYVDDYQVHRAAVEHCIDRNHPRTEVTVTYEAH